MKTPTLSNPLQALRGLRSLALAALTVATLGVAVSTSNAQTLLLDTWDGGGFNSSRVAGSSPGTLINVATTTTLTKISVRASLSAPGNVKFLVFDHATHVLVYASAPKAFPAAGEVWMESDPLSVTLNAGSSYDIGAIADVSGQWRVDGSSASANGLTSVVNNVNFSTFAAPTAGGHAGADGAVRLYSGGSTVLFTKGDAVPGAGVHPSIPAGATFSGFGVPSINESGTVAFLGKWTSTAGNGTGIFANGALVTKVGDEVVPVSGVKIKSMKDPVLDDMGYVAFPAALIGTGISGTNDSAIISNAPGGVLAIVAQEGTQAADAPVGALWKSFASTAAPGGGGGVLILGFMAQGAGGITAANDNGLWSADGAGALHLMLQEGTTAIGAKTVKSFAVLKALSGTPGQTHAHNTNAELVSKVTFTDGFQAIVHTALP